jgi:hypothetical protein
LEISRKTVVTRFVLPVLTVVVVIVDVCFALLLRFAVNEYCLDRVQRTSIVPITP